MRCDNVFELYSTRSQIGVVRAWALGVAIHVLGQGRKAHARTARQRSGCDNNPNRCMDVAFWLDFCRTS